PELFKIGPFAVHSYGVLLAAAFLIGISIARKRAINAGEKEEHIINLSYIVIISSIIGSRLFYVLFHISEFQGRWKYTFWPVQEDGTIGIGGLILLGGVIFAFAASFFYLRHHKLSFLKYGDIAAPVIPLGIFFGRLGCFFNGCCFGKECAVPWGVSFPADSPAGAVMGHISLHPTQLYEAFFNLLLFAALLWGSRYIKKYNGILLSLFLIGYGIERFIVDFFRHYEEQMFLLPGLDFNQIISLVMIAGGVVFLVRNKLKNV
ncbi:MAG: prolipoprotein diacylglyceryl transferase, partial [Calditrichia bacterium]|nr:prolipoprotein diacylglyceryl transferase [Calditrichia bacterium]